MMQTMNISLPDHMKAYVDSQVAEGSYSRASECIRALIRDNERRRAEAQLEAALLEGLCGKKSELTRHDFDDIRRVALARLESRQRR